GRNSISSCGRGACSARAALGEDAVRDHSTSPYRKSTEQMARRVLALTNAFPRSRDGEAKQERICGGTATPVGGSGSVCRLSIRKRRQTDPLSGRGAADVYL